MAADWRWSGGATIKMNAGRCAALGLMARPPPPAQARRRHGDAVELHRWEETGPALLLGSQCEGHGSK